MRCEGKESLRCDRFGFGDDPRIKKRIANTAVGGPYVQCEHEFSRRPIIRRTSDSHDARWGRMEERYPGEEPTFYKTEGDPPHFPWTRGRSPTWKQVQLDIRELWLVYRAESYIPLFTRALSALRKVWGGGGSSRAPPGDKKIAKGIQLIQCMRCGLTPDVGPKGRAEKLEDLGDGHSKPSHFLKRHMTYAADVWNWNAIISHKTSESSRVESCPRNEYLSG